MIVNPQEFNYKFTIGILVVVIAVFSTFGLTSYINLKSDNDFLVQEKKHLHNELSTIINRYDALNSENLSLKSQIDSTNYQKVITNITIEKLENSLISAKAGLSELNFLRNKNSNLENKEDSLIKLAEQIEEERRQTLKELAVIKEKQLLESNEKTLLENRLEKASMISANSFSARAYRLAKKETKFETNKAKEVSIIELCFAVAENSLSIPGKRNIYVQVIDPNNNVVSDKGAISFGDDSLIYSGVNKLDYNNKALDVCMSFNNYERFISGTYYINVFEENRRLGGTQIQLN